MIRRAPHRISAAPKRIRRLTGKKVASQKMERTPSPVTQWDENLEVGADADTPMSDEDYRVRSASRARSTS